ncbi:MAG: DUF4143 domain-containing protein [Candidatus Aramenus sp.]|jgi:predicted AAA+ superfamily ATPase|nr:DUF4143 domain-containing protein [Candidatus Aramenus sp.]
MEYTPERGRVLSLLKEFLHYGSLPAVVLEKDDREKVRLLKSYFESVVIRNFSSVKPTIASLFASYLVSNYARPITVNNVYAYLKGLGLKVGKETVLELFNMARETYFSFPVEEFKKSERKRKANPKKLYLIDVGYVTALGFESSISHAMENSVYLELRRRGFKDQEVFYWKGKREIDFVVAKNFNPTTLIQVTYATDRVEERKVEGILEAKSQLKVDDALIITWDYSGEVKGVRAVPLWKWLLEDDKG